MENKGLKIHQILQKVSTQFICSKLKVRSPCYWLFILGRLQLALVSSLQEIVGLFSVIMELTVHCQNDFLNVQAWLPLMMFRKLGTLQDFYPIIFKYVLAMYERNSEPTHRGLKLDGAIGQGEICNSLKSEKFSKSFLSHTYWKK